MSIGETCVIQVTNIAPSATKEQMSTLFGFIGHIKEICLYPNDDTPVHVSSKVCYIRYAEPWSVGVAQHLTNTVFVDRALIVLPVNDGKIPDEASAMTLTNSGIGGINSGVVSQMVTGIGGTQMITTIDPKLTALNLSQYPPLPANMDPTKIEEIRRTVYVGNLDSSISAEQLLKFFNQIGEVKYVRMAGEESQPTRFAFIEFTDQSSVANALQYSGVVFGGRPIKINHSNNAIVKPQVKNSEAVQKEIEEAMKRVREAQSLISAAIEPGYFDKILDTNERKRSRSRSRSRRKTRSRSRDRRRRSRSRSRERRRSGSRSRDRRRSRSPRKRSRSKERRRSRSRSRDRRHRRRSRSRERRNRRSRSRERTSRRRSRTRSHSRSRRDERERSKEKERLRERLKTEIESQPEGPQLPPEEIENKDIDEVEVKKESSSPLKYRDSPISPRRSISPRSRRIRSPRRSRSRERRRRRDRSRSRERHSKEKKRKRRDRDGSSERESKEGSWIKRDYDEEEKGYDSGSDSRRLRRSPLSPDD